MKGFGFSLADNTCLREDVDGYYLLSTVPLRILRLNKSLFMLLKHLQEGGDLSEFAGQNPRLKEPHLLRGLLSLTSRGYLKLERIGEIEDYPSVSVVVPVKDQVEDLLDCIISLSGLDYPKDKLEVLVVDDASEGDISQFASSDIKVIRLAESRGPAVCRNIGVANTQGDILAFLDADCIARENWLKELMPFFQAETVGAVGGYVEGYYQDGFLDRYEEVSSPLNMGKRLLLEGNTESTLYVPTANLLVTREALTEIRGFTPGMHIGEDVDFCWRLRNFDYTLLYAPCGKVAHKHRNDPGKMLARRGDYGTSEASLYRYHRDKKKTFLISIYTGLFFLALTLAILLMNPYPLIAIPLIFGYDVFRKSATLKKYKMALPFRQIAYSILRSYLSFCYFAFFHLVRYYLILIFALGFLLNSLWLFSGLAILLTSIVDYSVKKPSLAYPTFLLFYILEHLAYQIGVFWGCLKLKYFGSYIISFKRA